MKAIVLTEYGSPQVLQLREVPKPAPKANELLIRVRATTVNYGDLLARNFKAVTPRDFNMPWLFWFFAKISFGFTKPKITILGSEFTGEVEAVGNDVKSFQPGDAVFGYLGQNMGAYAEYLCIAADGCVTSKPTNLSHEEAAALPYGAIMTVSLLQKANIQPGQTVLINGASGAIGAAAVQLAKFHYGATVTGVCGTPRVEFVEALGADTVIDYTREDFTQNDQTYDLIFDVLGKRTFDEIKGSLKPTGVHLLASFKLKHLFQMVRTSRSEGKKVVCALAPGSRADLLAVKELAEAGKLTPILDRCYPLEQAAAAHRYVEEGHRKGKVVITV